MSGSSVHLGQTHVFFSVGRIGIIKLWLFAVWVFLRRVFPLEQGVVSCCPWVLRSTWYGVPGTGYFEVPILCNYCCKTFVRSYQTCRSCCNIIRHHEERCSGTNFEVFLRSRAIVPPLVILVTHGKVTCLWVPAIFCAARH
ncbi:unnamed protein product [Pylaiella littoralis]